MNVRKEIAEHAKEEDKEILTWLFNRYHKEREWFFVAKCRFERFGKYSYQAHRIWAPTNAGRAIFLCEKAIAQSIEVRGALNACLTQMEQASKMFSRDEEWQAAIDDGWKALGVHPVGSPPAVDEGIPIFTPSLSVLEAQQKGQYIMYAPKGLRVLYLWEVDGTSLFRLPDGNTVALQHEQFARQAKIFKEDE